MFFYTRYSNSLLATLISGVGGLLVAAGVILLFSGEGIAAALACAGIGGLLMFAAKKISEKKEEREDRKNR